MTRFLVPFFIILKGGIINTRIKCKQIWKITKYTSVVGKKVDYPSSLISFLFMIFIIEESHNNRKRAIKTKYLRCYVSRERHSTTPIARRRTRDNLCRPILPAPSNERAELFEPPRPTQRRYRGSKQVSKPTDENLLRSLFEMNAVGC